MIHFLLKNVFTQRNTKGHAELTWDIFNFRKDQDVRLKIGYEVSDKVFFLIYCCLFSIGLVLLINVVVLVQWNVVTLCWLLISKCKCLGSYLSNVSICYFIYQEITCEVSILYMPLPSITGLSIAIVPHLCVLVLSKMKSSGIWSLIGHLIVSFLIITSYVANRRYHVINWR